MGTARFFEGLQCCQPDNVFQMHRCGSRGQRRSSKVPVNLPRSEALDGILQRSTNELQNKTYVKTVLSINFLSLVDNRSFRSICQKNSWASLDICQPMLRIITDTHSIMPEFLNLVRSFHDRTSNVEQAFSSTCWRRLTTELKGAMAIRHNDIFEALRQCRNHLRYQVPREQWSNRWCRSLVNAPDWYISELRHRDQIITVDSSQPAVR